MMKPFACLFMTLLLFLAACGGQTEPVAGPPQPTEVTAPPTTAPADPTSAAPAAVGEIASFRLPADLFTGPANPLTVRPEADGSRAVTAVIPLEGGVLTAAAADGSRFTLAIPAGALLWPTEISLTPLAALGDLPFSGGLVAGVALAPDGLALLEIATLTIEPARAVPAAEQILFGYLGDGEDLHLHPAATGTDVFQLPLLHFSGYGLGQGTASERTAVAGHQPSRAEARFNSQLGQILQTAGTGDPDYADRLLAHFEQYERDVIRPALARAGDGCEQGKQALNQFLRFERLRQLLGVAPEENSLAQLADLINTVGLKCVQEAYEACVEDHQLTEIIPAVLQFERLRQLLGMTDEEDPTFRQLLQLIRNCFTFELEFDSVVGSEVEGSGYDAAVRARVIITLDSLIPFNLSGAGVMDAMYYTVSFDGCTQGETISQGDQFEVLSLNFTLSGPPDDPEITGLEMLYVPGQTAESARLNCEGIAFTVPPIPSPVWTGLYTAMHLDNLAASSPGAAPPNLGQLMGSSGGDDDDLAENFPGLPTLPLVGTTGMAGAGGFVIKDWQLRQGELYAVREYDREQEFMYEVTTFNLYHRPPR